ncbi:hypothetical protein [Insulibacter thermoxylanivorax]|uniref:hypothetical protein n=1 Tax=Insulibacter thermoxylanivorax TaxID=2749268 RepID=UPI00190FF7A7|nr:hypothetical protein [Insulibacter thermoxylanivorax]
MNIIQYQNPAIVQLEGLLCAIHARFHFPGNIRVFALVIREVKAWKTQFRSLVLAVVLTGSLILQVTDAFWETTGGNIVHDPTIIRVGNTWHVLSTGQGIQRLMSTDGIEARRSLTGTAIYYLLLRSMPAATA